VPEEGRKETFHYILSIKMSAQLTVLHDVHIDLSSWRHKLQAYKHAISMVQARYTSNGFLQWILAMDSSNGFLHGKQRLLDEFTLQQQLHSVDHHLGSALFWASHASISSAVL
jgi:sRNA-binding regulator protein Hfq